jgi:FdhD protein
MQQASDSGEKQILRKSAVIAVDVNGARATVVEVCIEDCISILLNSLSVAYLKVTPADLEAFAVGHMICEGFVPSYQDIRSVVIDYPEIHVTVPEIEEQILGSPTEIRSAGSGLRTADNCRLTPLGSGIRIDLETLFEGTRLTHQASPIWKRTGGTHCTVILDQNGGVISAAEDVGRHNSIDKAVGKAVLQGNDLTRCFMVCTGRLPADMVAKAFRAGISILVSNNAPFSSGIDFAEEVNMTLAGFARPPKVSIYTHPERICIPPLSPNTVIR